MDRGAWWAAVRKVAQSRTRLMWLSTNNPSEKATYYMIPTIWYFQRRQWHPTPGPLAWKIPWTEEPVMLQSMGSLRVRHDWATSLSLFTFLHWRRKWQPTPVFLPGESRGWGAWWAAVYGVTQSQKRLKWLSIAYGILEKQKLWRH